MRTEEQKAKAREKSARYRATHLEQAREYTRKWRAENKERAADLARVARQAWMKVPANRIRNTLCQVKRRAAAAGRDFSITIEDLLPLPSTCPVLGTPLNYDGTNRRGFVDDSASIDRLDSARGYVAGNVRIISWRANRLKQDSTVAELEAVLRYMKESKCS